MPEYQIRHPYVRTLAQQVGDAHTHDPQHKIEKQRQHHPTEQHVEGRHRFGRNYPVVYLHRKQHTGKAQDVRRQGSQHDMAIGTHVAQDDVFEPALVVGFFVIINPRIPGRLAGPQNQRLARRRKYLGTADAALQALVATVDNAQFIVVVEGLQHADLAIVKLQHQRQSPVHQQILAKVDDLQAHAGLSRHLTQYFVDICVLAPLGGNTHILSRVIQAMMPGNK